MLDLVLTEITDYFEQNRDSSMELSFFNDEKIDELKVYLNEIANWGDLFVILQTAHDGFTELLTELKLSFLASFSYQCQFLPELPIPQSKNGRMKE